MAKLVVSEGQYLVSHDKWPKWTGNKNEAKRFGDDDPDAELLAIAFSGEIVKVTNTKIEQRVLGRQRHEARQRLAAHEKERKENGHR